MLSFLEDILSEFKVFSEVLGKKILFAMTQKIWTPKITKESWSRKNWPKKVVLEKIHQKNFDPKKLTSKNLVEKNWSKKILPLKKLVEKNSSKTY